jgi:hypothetical protein
MATLGAMFDQLERNPQRLFLIDSIGAMLSAALLGGLLANFETYFGMPRPQLYILALIAVVFAMYSLTCFFAVKANWRPYLTAIAIANLAYCGLTIALMAYFSLSLTSLGIAYFVGEMVVVGCLVSLELRTVFSSLRKKVQ